MAKLGRSIMLVFLLALAVFLADKSDNNKPIALDSRWVKLDFDGNTMNSWAGPWSCILDKNTGLVWENKDLNEGIHDANWTYSWYNMQGLGVEDRGDCNFNNIRCDTQDIVQKAQLEKTCGLTDWRLPTAKELDTIVNRNVLLGEPVINTDFFPYTKRNDYWTADGQRSLAGGNSYLKEGATAVNFIEGEKVILPYRNAAYVRLVSGKINL